MPDSREVLPYLTLAEKPVPDSLHAGPTVAAITDLAARCADRHRPADPDDLLRLALLVDDAALLLLRIAAHDTCHGGYDCADCEDHDCWVAL